MLNTTFFWRKNLVIHYWIFWKKSRISLLKVKTLRVKWCFLNSIFNYQNTKELKLMALLRLCDHKMKYNFEHILNSSCNCGVILKQLFITFSKVQTSPSATWPLWLQFVMLIKISQNQGDSVKLKKYFFLTIPYLSTWKIRLLND